MPINRHAVELGVLVGLVNVFIFTHNLPPVSDVRSATPFNAQVESAERTALLESTILTLVVAGFARSVETFMIGGLVVVGVDFVYKHANAVNPNTNQMVPAGQAGLNQAQPQSHPLPDYSMAPTGDTG
jgi:hypothetical protein